MKIKSIDVLKIGCFFVIYCNCKAAAGLFNINRTLVLAFLDDPITPSCKKISGIEDKKDLAYYIFLVLYGIIK